MEHDRRDPFSSAALMGGQFGALMALAPLGSGAGAIPAVTAATPAMAVAGSGLVGLAAGTLASELLDGHKGGVFGQDAWGNDQSGFDAAAGTGRWAEGLVDGALGDPDSTLGTVAGAATSGALSIVNAPLAAADAIYGWFAD